MNINKIRIHWLVSTILFCIGMPLLVMLFFIFQHHTIEKTDAILANAIMLIADVFIFFPLLYYFVYRNHSNDFITYNPPFKSYYPFYRWILFYYLLQQNRLIIPIIFIEICINIHWHWITIKMIELNDKIQNKFLSSSEECNKIWNHLKQASTLEELDLKFSEMIRDKDYNSHFEELYYKRKKELKTNP